MKICVLTDAWTPVWGGGQEHIWQIYRRLVNTENCQVDILVPNIKNQDGQVYPAKEEHFKDKLQILRLGPSFAFPDILGRALNLVVTGWWLLLHDYDIYHSHSNASILLPLIKFFRPGRKYIYTVHGAAVKLVGAGKLDNIGISSLGLKLWRWLVYDFSWDALLTAAQSTIVHPVTAKNFLVIGNGVDIAEFDKIPMTKNRKQFKVIWVGRSLDPVKGLENFQKALKEIQQTDPLIISEIITNRPHREVVNGYKAADLFVMSSVSEGLPLSLLEAMAASLPVVVTNVGDCRKIVEEADCGLVVPPDNPHALAEAIKEMASKKNRLQLGINGHQFVKDKYTWDKIAQKQYALYHKILS